MKITKNCNATIDIGNGSVEKVFEAMLGKTLPKEAVLVKVEEKEIYDVFGCIVAVTRALKFEWTETEEL